MLGAEKGAAGRPHGPSLSIGIVRARFNEEVTATLLQACLRELAACGVAQENIARVEVPGALEIGCALQALAESGKFDALIALGCVIRGETYHFELVANESGAAVTRLSIDYRLPIANAILTVENLAQAQARQDEKGGDAARVAVEMANLLKDLA